MHWRSLKEKQPLSGSECIVKHLIGNIYHYGIYMYYSNVWCSDIRDLNISDSDYWCYVDDVTDYVSFKLKEELQYAISHLRSL